MFHFHEFIQFFGNLSFTIIIEYNKITNDLQQIIIAFHLKFT